jgi:hypothetical protein
MYCDTLIEPLVFLYVHDLVDLVVLGVVVDLVDLVLVDLVLVDLVLVDSVALMVLFRGFMFVQLHYAHIKMGLSVVSVL